jgi:O-antigen/teichoic acid export membrane protein
MTAEPLAAKQSSLTALRKLLDTNQMASWAGQGLVSAMNFVVLIMLARYAGAIEVGYYAVAFSILIMAMVMQDSLVTRPYAIQLFKPPDGPEAHAYGALIFGLTLSATIGLGLAAAAFAMHLLEPDARLTSLFLVLSVVTPLAMSRDFARRFSFANLQMRQALAVDAAASTILLLLLVILAWRERLDATTALFAIGIAGAFSALIWLWFSRSYFKRKPGAARQTAKLSWSFGKWLLSSQIALQVQGYAAHWITFLVAGAAATGLYSACLSIVGLANPFLFGLFNMLTPKFVRALKDGGEAGLRRAAFRDTLLIGAIMGAFAMFLIMGGSFILPLLFPGEDFAGGQNILSILALSSAIAAMGAPATIALSAAERGRAIAGLSFAICLLGSITVWLLLLRWGLMGAAIGILITESVGAAARWALFLLGIRLTHIRNAPE